MENNVLFIVTSLKEYEDGEKKFGAEALFETEKAAKDYVLAEMSKEMARYCEDDNVTADYEGLVIQFYDALPLDSSYFMWDIQKFSYQVQKNGKKQWIETN